MRRVQMQIHQMEKEEDLQRRVDEILDKINRVGYENLTRAEKNLLKKASDYLSKRNSR